MAQDAIRSKGDIPSTSGVAPGRAGDRAEKGPASHKKEGLGHLLLTYKKVTKEHSQVPERSASSRHLHDTFRWKKTAIYGMIRVAEMAGEKAR